MIPLLFLLSPLSLTTAEAEAIAKKIWHNECCMSIDGLTSWNEGEKWTSLGLGHFIWYSEGQKGMFEEQFPAFIAFAKDHTKIPSWLQGACPWRSRQEFLEAFHSEEMIELREFLHSTLHLQAQFIAFRLENVLEKMTSELPEDKKRSLTKKFRSVASASNGIYALADYLNFKGDGLSSKERYQGQGWGLLQVLQTMKTGADPLEAFITSAKTLLTQRVHNAPAERHEERWLKGWCNRLDSYRNI